MDKVYIIRTIFILLLGSAAWYLQPFQLARPFAAALGVILGLGIVIGEIQVRKITLKRLFGAAFGSLLGIVGAYLISLFLGHAFPAGSATALLYRDRAPALDGLCRPGGGRQQRRHAESGRAWAGCSAARPAVGQSFKILDTSVIIDGRIADIVETGFLDGTLVIPQFVLRELQLVADSADSLKRNRGRRGLDVLQRIQKMTQLNVQILEDDFPNVPEVDMKLIELAKVYDCKIVTNDFNLNKVAQLHGVRGSEHQ